jgi:hypothetical protein
MYFTMADMHEDRDVIGLAPRTGAEMGHFPPLPSGL